MSLRAQLMCCRLIAIGLAMVFLDLPHPLRPRYHHLALLHQEDSEPEAAGRIFQGCRLRRNHPRRCLRHLYLFGALLGRHHVPLEQRGHNLATLRWRRSHPYLYLL